MDFGESRVPYDPMQRDKGYHYSYGRKQHYASSRQGQPYANPQGEGARRLFFSNDVAGIDSGPQSVDQILRHGFFDVPQWDSATAMIQDRQQTSWLGLEDVLGQIQQRADIYRNNMNEILWNECYAFNELARTGWPASPDQWNAYHRRMADLGDQKRTERVKAWQDVSELRQLIPESMQQYLSAMRKSDLLEDLGGDPL